MRRKKNEYAVHDSKNILIGFVFACNLLEARVLAERTYPDFNHVILSHEDNGD